MISSVLIKNQHEMEAVTSRELIETNNEQEETLSLCEQIEILQKSIIFMKENYF